MKALIFITVLGVSLAAHAESQNVASPMDQFIGDYSVASSKCKQSNYPYPVNLQSFSLAKASPAANGGDRYNATITIVKDEKTIQVWETGNFGDSNGAFSTLISSNAQYDAIYSNETTTPPIGYDDYYRERNQFKQNADGTVTYDFDLYETNPNKPNKADYMIYTCHTILNRK